MTKKCLKCGVDKDIEQFSMRNKAKNTRKSYCKECVAKDRLLEYIPCSQCGNLKKPKSKVCRECEKKNKEGLWKDKKLSDVEYSKFKSAKYSYVRFFARQVIINEGRLSCEYCGYNKHIEAAHIKPITDFHPDTLLKEINSSDNLLSLCPNHHFEFDRGKITIEDINPPARPCPGKTQL